MAPSNLTLHLLIQEKLVSDVLPFNIYLFFFESNAIVLLYLPPSAFLIRSPNIPKQFDKVSLPLKFSRRQALQYLKMFCKWYLLESYFQK